ncbi:MAG: FHA domain-containing protein [Deltaproteobacteria bacterium]|nr:FHA domain-containing protein [Deltaproteobacteria bacterium]
MKLFRLIFNMDEGKTSSQELIPGVYLIGRMRDCDIMIDHSTISQHHAKLTLTEREALIEDLGSSNGVLVNGVRVTKEKLGLPAQLCLGEVYLQLSQESAARPAAEPFRNTLFPPRVVSGQTRSLHQLTQQIRRRALALIRLINHHVEWKFALVAGLALFAALNTLMTLLPLMGRSHQYLKDEAQKRAIFIAKQLADANERAVLFRNHLLLSTRLAEQQTGIISAQIVDPEGRVLAPAHKANRQIDGALEIASLLTQETLIQEMSKDELLITEPITSYSETDGKNRVRALAQVRFSVKDLGMTAEGMWRLVLISLTTAILLSILFYFALYFLTAEPLLGMDDQLAESMKGSFHPLTLNAKFQEFVPFLTRINILLTRLREGVQEGELLRHRDEGEGRIFLQHRYLEPLIESIETPAFVLDHHQQIVSANTNAGELCRARIDSLLRQPIYDFFPDRDLQSTIADLIQLSRSKLDGSPAQENITTRDGSSFALSVTAFVDSASSGANYHVISIKKLDY